MMNSLSLLAELSKEDELIANVNLGGTDSFNEVGSKNDGLFSPVNENEVVRRVAVL